MCVLVVTHFRLVGEVVEGHVGKSVQMRETIADIFREIRVSIMATVCVRQPQFGGFSFDNCKR